MPAISAFSVAVALAVAAAARAATTVDVSYEGAAALAVVAPTYLSTNVDSASLANNVSFTDPVFIALTRALVRAAPTQLRIGGGAADSAAFTGAGGPRGLCSGFLPHVDVCVDAVYWDELAAFVEATGVELVWDLNAKLRRPTGEWDSTNAAELLQHIASRGGTGPSRFQLGNEPEDWYKATPPLNISGAALARDYAALRSLLAATPGVAQVVNGPDACCEDRRPILADFAAAAAAASPPLVSALTVHAYPIPRGVNDTCRPELYISKAAAASLAQSLAAYAVAAAPLVAVGVPLVLGETATSAHGGCANLSNAFVAGFTFWYELGSVGEAPGFVQVSAWAAGQCAIVQAAVQD